MKTTFVGTQPQIREAVAFLNGGATSDARIALEMAFYGKESVKVRFTKTVTVTTVEFEIAREA